MPAPFTGTMANGQCRRLFRGFAAGAVIAGFDRLPGGQIRAPLDCRAVAPRLAATGRSMLQTHALSTDFGISEIFLTPGPNQPYSDSVPPPYEGRFAIVTDVRRDAVDAKAHLTKCADADGKNVWS